MAAQYDLFISYAHEDGDIAASLASRFDDAGLHCFLAEKDIVPSEQWEPRILDALCSSQSVFLLLTPRSKDSRWVNAEAGAAWALRKPLIPALMFVKPHEVIELIRSYQAYQVETPKQVQILIDKLKTLRADRAVRTRDRGHINAALDSPLGRIVLSRPEVFNNTQHWDALLKIGKWTLDEATGEFTGKGMRTYLLSQQKYGPQFTMSTQLCFVEGHPVNAVDAINAGIVLGWDTPDGICRYHHLMFTGTRVLVELVGASGGGECRDYRHLDEGVPFALEEGREYGLVVVVEPKRLILLIDNRVEYNIALLHPCEGRVGLRPWRSTMKCRHFEVTALASLPRTT